MCASPCRSGPSGDSMLNATIGVPVLVIEDEPTIAEAVAVRLRSEGFAVEVAGDGQRYQL